MRIITVEEHYSMPGTSPMAGMGSGAGALNAGAVGTALAARADLGGLSIDSDRVAAMDAAGIDLRPYLSLSSSF